MIERKHIEAIEDAAKQFSLGGCYRPSSDDLFAAISAALAAIGESPWRSMESAPKDGSEFLVLVHDESDGQTALEVHVTKWDHGVWAVPFDYDSWFAPDCLVAWRPLPAAPEAKP